MLRNVRLHPIRGIAVCFTVCVMVVYLLNMRQLDVQIAKRFKTSVSNRSSSFLLPISVQITEAEISSPVPITVKITKTISSIETTEIRSTGASGDSKFPVPNIVHYIWFKPPGSKQAFRFHHYLGILSVAKRIKPDKLYFWHDILPDGKWWEEAKKTCEITMKFRKAPTSIFNHTVNVPEHKADVARLEIVREFGGIYLDFDNIALKSFDPLRRYNFTLGAERSGLCNGVIISQPRSKFIELWYENYRDFNDKLWIENSIIRALALSEKHPDWIHIERKSLTFPTWEELDLIFGDKKFDWSHNYGIHTWYRYHNKDYDPETIKDLKGTIGEIFRFTYYDDPKMLPRNTV